jgi:hypothetical protein
LPDTIHELNVELARSFDIFLGKLTQLLGNFKLLVLGHERLLTVILKLRDQS